LHVSGRTHGRREDERGFGLVEVLIAALLLMIVATSAVYMLVSSGRSLRTADVHRMRAEVARAVVQQLSESQAWGATNPACRESALPGRPACNVSALVANRPYLTQHIAGKRVSFTVAATAQGIDSPADGVGPADRDRRVPDWFELRVVVAGGGPPKPLVLDASTDSATRGTGGLVLVRACAASNQSDDRIEPGTCDRAVDVSVPPPSGTGPSLDRDRVAYAVAPTWAKHVRLEPAVVRCSLNGPRGATQSLVTSSVGNWISPVGLAPGTWRLACSTPSGFEPWSALTTPVGGTLNVQEGRTTTAFVMYRRPPRTVTIHQATIHYFRYQTCSASRCIGPLTRTTFEQRFETYGTDALRIPIQPIPSPYGRQSLPVAVEGSNGVRVSLRPGLYGNTVAAGTSQYYLYTGTENRTSLGVEFGAPISWFYVHPDGRVETGPADQDRSGLWLVRWYCHSGDSPIQLACPEGRVPIGRGPLQLGGAGGRGGG
jgi:Tfp pilus assembly protein PilV